MVNVAYGSLPFKEQIEFFRRKANVPTNSYVDIYNNEHDYAFVVAGANRNALLNDFRAAIDKAISQGTTLDEFRKDFAEIVERHGWSYNGGFNWRTRIIYETNLNSSYQAGRYQQLRDAKFPYMEYLHSDYVEHPRELHQSWDHLVLDFNDPWWNTHFPPNGYGCQCRVRGRTKGDLKRMGKNQPDKAPTINWVDRVIGENSGNPRIARVPEGIDPSFEHIPGQSRLDNFVPNPLDTDPTLKRGLPSSKATDEWPAIREVSKNRLLEKGLTEEDYANIFLNEFGATLTKPAIFKDVAGDALVIGKQLFTVSKTGELKVTKRGREQFLLLLADSLKLPDEIWTRMEYFDHLQKSVVRRRYISRFMIDGEVKPMLAVFEVGDDGWLGVTTFAPDNPDYLEQLRVGVRVFKRT
ncbi:PBECR2 nuclease fold domain-containing protein [Gilliamella intestini]|uniref:Phage Mu protein F like protein n=1 Tax=Gilliamella intestini TaxID=1798183 RepID=A0A1C4BM89_9GAMM|nr:PBECR2 nuclease fold domain-containing protein [Gilliamella intestini]SCC08039.1 Phage Mu protein F like protein [Gilliamella intestini]